MRLRGERKKKHVVHIWMVVGQEPDSLGLLSSEQKQREDRRRGGRGADKSSRRKPFVVLVRRKEGWTITEQHLG